MLKEVEVAVPEFFFINIKNNKISTCELKLSVCLRCPAQPRMLRLGQRIKKQRFKNSLLQRPRELERCAYTVPSTLLNFN